MNESREDNDKRWELDLAHGVHAIIERSDDDPYAQFITFPGHPVWLPGGWGQGTNVAWRGGTPPAEQIKAMQDQGNTREAINRQVAKDVEQYEREWVRTGKPYD